MASKRIYELTDESESDVYFMTDKAGRPDALKKDLQLIALKADLLPVEPAAAYLDFNFAGWAVLNGVYILKGLGADFSNAFFTLQAAATYLFRVEVSNLSGFMHSLNVFVSSADDPTAQNRHATRNGADLTEAIESDWNELKLSPFAYVVGIQAIQASDDTDRINSTGDWLTTGVTITATEQAPTTQLRFDSSFLTSGSTGGAQVQFRILENGVEVVKGGIIEIGNDTISNSFSFIVNDHAPEPPTVYEVEFKNIGGTITLFGSQKASTMIFTEIYQKIG